MNTEYDAYHPRIMGLLERFKRPHKDLGYVLRLIIIINNINGSFQPFI